MLQCRGNALAQGVTEQDGIKEHLSLSLLPLEMDFICLSVFVIFFFLHGPGNTKRCLFRFQKARSNYNSFSEGKVAKGHGRQLA